MIKRKYIKKAYIEEAYCDKCGSLMTSTEEALLSYPAKYPYKCSNPKCDNKIIFKEDNKPGIIHYEFEEKKEIIKDKYNIIAIIGEAGTGKDTILKKMTERFESSLHEIVSYTSRPKREGEKEGINYHFNSKKDFEELINQHRMLEYTEFNGWYYGTGINSIVPNKINIGVFNPEGVKQLKNNSNVNVIVWRITCEDTIRLKRQLEREKNPNIDEIVRRYQTDKKDFSILDFEIDRIIPNNSPDELSQNIATLKEEIKRLLSELN